MSNDIDEPTLKLALDHAFLSLDLSEYGLTLDEFEKDPWNHLRRIGLEEIAKQRYCVRASRLTQNC